MSDCIDREALFAKFDRMGLGEHSLIEKLFSDGVRTVIAGMPAADVAPVQHGRWELRHGSWYCSNCGRGYKIKCGVVTACKHNYCPNCGAKMDGVQ